ncbi:MAG TPA: glycosyltransferase family 2 protein [Candidatus Sulfotelmatobacter sp.]|jgi:glycosyltransferase involved in cell wall biosynthesis|nr:glycosyltransferase family 2 protein [Candidatus Sulfotelmatobacter sp.]
MKKITILIPCYNEEKGISRVIDGVPVRLLKKLGLKTEIVVVNNNSTDKTAIVAYEKNVRVVDELKKGKGHAVMTGFNSVDPDTDYVVMLDGDNTYKSKEVLRLIEPLINDFCDVVIGSRLGGKMRKNSLKFRNRVANWVYTFLVRQFYQANITDVLSGYFAWKKEVIDDLKKYLDSEGFEIEMDMITKMKRLGYQMYSVPITYDERAGETKIQAISDGMRVLRTFFKNLNWSPRKKPSKKFFFNQIQKMINYEK